MCVRGVRRRRARWILSIPKGTLFFSFNLWFRRQRFEYITFIEISFHEYN